LGKASVHSFFAQSFQPLPPAPAGPRRILKSGGPRLRRQNGFDSRLVCRSPAVRPSIWLCSAIFVSSEPSVWTAHALVGQVVNLRGDCQSPPGRRPARGAEGLEFSRIYPKLAYFENIDPGPKSPQAYTWNWLRSSDFGFRSQFSFPGVDGAAGHVAFARRISTISAATLISAHRPLIWLCSSDFCTGAPVRVPAPASGIPLHLASFVRKPAPGRDPNRAAPLPPGANASLPIPGPRHPRPESWYKDMPAFEPRLSGTLPLRRLPVHFRLRQIRIRLQRRLQRLSS